MIAMLIGSLLLVGLVSLFGTTSSVNRLENGLARAQENGRFALSMITSDIRMATGTRSVRKGSGLVGQAPRDISIRSYVDLSAGPRAQHGLPRVGTNDFYFIPRSVMFRGYECIADACTPTQVPETGAIGGDQYGTIPALGTSAGSRVRGADVLTLRYVRGEGVRVGAVTSTTITLADPADRISIGPSGLAVIDDYQGTNIISVQPGTNLTSLTLQGNISAAPDVDVAGDARVSDFDSSLITVTYYLQLDEDPNRPERLISTLIRRENGQAQEIAQGIERLDFIYQVEDRNRNLRWLNAQEMTVATAINWPANEEDANTPALRLFDAPIAQWRAVQAVEVHLLANTVDDAASAQEPFAYSFLANGQPNVGNIVQMACDPAYGACPGGSITELPSGLSPGRMARREFRATVAVRNNSG